MRNYGKDRGASGKRPNCDSAGGRNAKPPSGRSCDPVNRCPPIPSFRAIAREKAMSQSVLFTTRLHDLMTARKITADDLRRTLNYQTAMSVQSWLNGWSRPPLWLLPALAKALKADPVEMMAGWVIDQLPRDGGSPPGRGARTPRIEIPPV